MQPPPEDTRRAARAARALRMIAGSPRQAYRGAVRAVTEPAPATSPLEPSDPFDQALHLLVGLDVVLTFEREGVTWTVAPGEDGIAEELFARGSYSAETITAMLSFLRARRPGRDWIIDVGANIGTTTIPFARAGFRVVAIEPAPAALRLLRRNVTDNGLEDSVQILEGAVASSEEVVLAVSTSLGNSEVLTSPSASPAFSTRYGRAEDIRVRAFSLETAIESCGFTPDAVALVWSDTQGSELATVETGVALWEAGVPLFSEFWVDGLDAHGGVEAFVAGASAQFESFIDAANGGAAIRQALRSDGGPAPEARPIEELAVFAESVREYPGGFTDILLLPGEPTQ